MEMFEDGGLKDQGGTVDPMSGNDVPVGSTQKEVRDDIPAQLSEGEFVFPADVVRFIGLEKLMGLRQQAKMGLKKMEQMGQMGNSDEATMPDDMPFGISDLIVVSPEGKEVEMAEGGVIQAATGVNVTPSNNPTMTNVQRANNPNTSYVPYTTASSVVPLPTQPVPTKPVVTPNTTPSFGDVMGDAKLVMRQYKNAAGYVIMIPHVGDKDIPIYPVPEGYYLVTEDGTTPSMPSTGTGETAPAETVKPEEGDREAPDSDGDGIPDNVEKSELMRMNRSLELLAGDELTPMEKLFNKLGLVKGLKYLDQKIMGDDTRGTTLGRTVDKLNTMIDAEEVNTPEFTELAGNFVDAAKGYKGDTDGDGIIDVNEDVDQIIDQELGFGDITGQFSRAGGKGYDIGISGPTSFGYTGSDDTPNTEFGPDTGSKSTDKSKDAPSTSIGGPVGSPQRSRPSQSPRGSGSIPDREGPDGNGGGGGGSGGGGGGNSGGSAGGGGGPYNKGGLAGKKPKKKATRKMKKGGLATSKK